MKLSEVLRKLQENPDDLSMIGEMISRAEEMEKDDNDATERIAKLQENNRKLVRMIPVPGEEKKEEEEKQPTIEDALNEIREQQTKGEI